MLINTYVNTPLGKNVVAFAIFKNYVGGFLSRSFNLKDDKKPLVIPAELQVTLDSDTSLAESFKALSLTNKLDLDYISEAKRSETRQKRLDKIIPMIAQGVGLNDKYKK